MFFTTLNVHVKDPDWRALTAVLSRIHTGARDPASLLADLDHIDSAIVQRALDYVKGNTDLGIHPRAWYALIRTGDAHHQWGG
jgi:hypothetical protein